MTIMHTPAFWSILKCSQLHFGKEVFAKVVSQLVVYIQNNLLIHNHICSFSMTRSRSGIMRLHPGGQPMNFIDQFVHPFRRGGFDYAVTEVEDVPLGGGKCVQYFLGALQSC